MEAGSIEKFKNIVMDLDLPREDSVLFGLVCPYCGKNDRIRPLEPPDDLAEHLESANLESYRELWNGFKQGGAEGTGLAVCKFCRNVLLISQTLSAVEAIYLDESREAGGWKVK